MEYQVAIGMVFKAIPLTQSINKEHLKTVHRQTLSFASVPVHLPLLLKPCVNSKTQISKLLPFFISMLSPKKVRKQKKNHLLCLDD
jgi:hypothetical protein